MAKTCLDTNVLIELARRKLIRYIDREDQLYIPWIVAYEYIRGLAYLGRDIGLVKHELESRFNIIYPTNSILVKAVEIYLSLRKRGELIPDPDILIAASCIANNIPLATMNRSHFDRIEGLELVDPKTIIEEYEALKKVSI